MALTEQTIIRQLNHLLEFLDPVHSLANSHMGSFFTENNWSKHVPSTIQSDLSSLNSVKSFIQLYPNIIKSNCPNKFSESHSNLLNFLNTAMSISITRKEQYLKLLKDLENLILIKNYKKKSDVLMEDFMSQKKFHEVKITSKITDFVSHLTKSSHIVDIGGGKGYLSCILALHYSFKVLGLDSSVVTTCGALKRSEKVAKMWSGEFINFTDDAQPLEVKTKKTREEYVQKHYKQIITFVHSETDVEDLLRKSFHEEITGITITGLHTCGDLASNCLRMFINCSKVRGIVNVGCCYNHISEKYIDENYNEGKNKNEENHGFPMSRFLREKNYKLGRNARMLAAHSLDRINFNSEFESSQTSIFYRAVLETVQTNSNLGQRNVGRLAKKCNNFHEYMSTALQKLSIDAELTEEDFDKLYEKYIDRKPFLTAFYLLRISLAPIVESIILLDRILYLIENGIDNVYLVPLFNLEISPRGFGIIAWKDFENS